jgi:hypothetical protein
VGCDDNTAGCAGNGSQVTWQASAGSVYYIRVGSPIAASGTGQLVYSCVTPPQCPADLDGDGLVDGSDLGVLLGAWGSAAADLNDDGVADGKDLGIMLGAWGSCP